MISYCVILVFLFPGAHTFSWELPCMIVIIAFYILEDFPSFLFLFSLTTCYRFLNTGSVFQKACWYYITARVIHKKNLKDYKTETNKAEIL